MKASRKWLFVFVLVAVFPLAVTSPALAAPTTYGQVTDSAGDSLDASADLIFGSVTTICTTNAIFRVGYATPGYDQANTFTAFQMDIDRNLLTGDSGFGMGADAIVWIYGSGFQGTGYYSRWSGSAWHDPLLSGTVPVTYLPTGAEVTVPLSALGSSDGLLDFDVVSQIHLDATTWTTILDLMPDLGSGLGTTRLVAPCIPAPAGILLLGSGLASLAAARRRVRTIR